MRPVRLRVSSATFSRWVGLNWRATDVGFSVGLGVVLSSGASLTYSVQHTFNNIYAPEKDWSGSRTTTTVTITKTNHGLSVGDWWKTDTAAPAPFAGEFAVAAITDADNFTYTVANSGATSVAYGLYFGAGAQVLPHSSLAAKTTSADGNYAFPPRACRLIVSTYASGFADFTVIQAGG